MNKEKIKSAINQTNEALKGIPEPDRSLSFPIILKQILEIPSKIAQATEEVFIPEDENSFKGLTGGIKLLISEGFFARGRTQGEIFQELRRQGYMYARTALPITLRKFYTTRGPLTRVPGENNLWHYAERK